MAVKKLMRAAIINAFGTPDVLEVGEVPIPNCNQDEVLIHVKAFSINPMDCKTRKHGFGEGYQVKFPLILGLDIAGTVAEVGLNVTDFKVGTNVYGYIDTSRMGAYAEYTIALPEEIAVMPKGMSFNEAAALPVAAITAWTGLCELAEIKPGQKVLIHGGAGGVGSIAVQIAKYRKAHVIATASPKNHSFLKTIGVDQVIDYHDDWAAEVSNDLDLVFDTVGGETQIKSFSCLKQNGVLVSIVEVPLKKLAHKYHVQTGFVWAMPSKKQLEILNELYLSKNLTPIVSHVFQFEDIQKSHTLSETGHVRGKIVVSTE